jgi:hypothetical protein
MAGPTTQNIRFAGARPAASDPAVDGDQFAASTTYTLTTHARGLWINTAGDVYVDFLGGQDNKAPSTNVKFTVPAGGLLPVCITKIYNTTTATGVVLY